MAEARNQGQSNEINQINTGRTGSENIELESAIKEVMSEGSTRIVAPLIKSLAKRMASKLGISPEDAEAAAEEIVRMISTDPEIERYIKAMRIAKLVASEGGEITERVSDIARAKIIHRLTKKLGYDNGADEDVALYLARMKRDIINIMYVAELMRTYRSILRDEDGEGLSKVISESISRAVEPLTKAIDELRSTLSNIHSRIDNLESRIREIEEKKKRDEIEQLSNAIEEIRRKLEELEKGPTKAPSDKGFSSPKEALDWLLDNIESLKKLGISIVTPDEKIRELEKKLEELEKRGASESEKRKIIEEIEKLRKAEAEDKDIKMKKLEIELERARGLSRFFERLGSAIGEIVKDIITNPDKLVRLVRAFREASISSESVEPAKKYMSSLAGAQPSSIDINIPSLEAYLGEAGGSRKGEKGVGIDAGGEEGGVREERAEGVVGGPEEGGEVRRPDVRSEGAPAVEGEVRGDSGGGGGSG